VFCFTLWFTLGVFLRKGMYGVFLCKGMYGGGIGGNLLGVGLHLIFGPILSLFCYAFVGLAWW